MANRLDHVVIGAASLTEGAAALQASLGVALPRGGKHAVMGTHNCLAQAGGGSYLELIAIDPEAVPPGRPRWFGLDDPATLERLALRPRALTWVVATDDLEALVATSPVDLGEIVPLSRGDLTWRLTVPADGGLPEAGLRPAIQ